MACGTPVVGYEGGSVGEVVGDAGRIVATGDLPALIDAARALIDHDAQRHLLAQRARRRVAERFNPATSLTKLKSIYASILSQGSVQQWAA